MNSKNLIPIGTHAHLINTCSSKFGATFGFKNVHLKQKSHSYYVHIVIIHYKHWLNDSSTLIWLYTPGKNTLFFPFFSCHTVVTGDLPSSSKCCFYFFFIQDCDPDKNFGRKNVTKTRSLDGVSNSKDVIAGPEYTRLQKIIVFFFFFTLQSLLCRFKIKKKNKVDSQRLHKNRQKRQIV